MSDLPEGLGLFDAGDLSFVIDDGYSLVAGADRVLDEQSLERRIHGVPHPLASWLVARLARVAKGTLALDADTIEVCEGAICVVDFVVRKGGSPVGKAQLQAGLQGAALLGMVSIDPELVIDRFVEALIASPHDVSICRVRARDPSWNEDRVIEYGFDGERYL